MKHFLITGITLSFLVLFNSFSLNESDKELPDLIREAFTKITSGKVVIIEEPEYASGFAIAGTSDTTRMDVSEFYISKYEVTNKEYQEFLKEYRPNASANDWDNVRIDSSKWMNHVTYATPFVDHYHVHPAYEEYPVVNVSHEGAEAYCQWLTKKINMQLENGTSVTLRLPTREEWVRAAREDEHELKYAWGNEELIDKSGELFCNFNIDKKAYNKLLSSQKKKTKRSVVVGTMDRLQSKVNVTSPVKAYTPSKNGLYNMNGNVAEMLNVKFVAMGGCWDSSSSEIQIESEMHYIAPSPYIGFRPVMVFN
ncbi:MAG: SUMF1/EgtB/PvdO family nonheme iron enzyme [Flavobacteriales bacterium]|nr:SUMF1/EgtB/PvdO family nonheme iron enzyme [Flavobacteriales bacterium]